MSVSFERRRFLRTGVAAAAALLATRGVARAHSPRVVITEPAAWLRAAPSLAAPRVVAVRKGEQRSVLARSANGRWLQLADAGGAAVGWLYSELTAFVSGGRDDAQVFAVPTAVPTSAAARGKPARMMGKSTPVAAPLPRWVPRITTRQRAVYAAAPKFGKDLGMFTVVGDCNSQPPVYLRRVANGEFDGSRVDARLQDVLTKFEASFGRVSLAAKGGFGTANMADPTWADGALCGVEVGPFECEVWVSRASVVFIELGTGDQYVWQDFEKHYRPLVELALRKGTLPVLVTKADDLESAEGAPQGYINSVVRKAAAELDVPLLDFHAATRDLPNFGLIDEGDKDFHLDGAGMQRHIEATLWTLAALVESV